MKLRTILGLTASIALACISVLSTPASSLAQTTAPITGEVFTIYRQGATSPAAGPFVLSRPLINCGAVPTPTPTGIAANPTMIRWANPADGGATDCVYADPTDGVLAMLAADSAVVYDAALRFRTPIGDTNEGPRSNLFTRPGALPAVPARLRVVSQ